MHPPINFLRPIARHLLSEHATILTFVVAASKNEKHPLVKRLPANLTMAANASYLAERKGIPPAPTDAAKLVGAVAVEPDVRHHADQKHPKEEIKR